MRNDLTITLEVPLYSPISLAADQIARDCCLVQSDGDKAKGSFGKLVRTF